MRQISEVCTWDAPGDFLTSIVVVLGFWKLFSLPLIFRETGGNGLELFVLERGSQNLECTGRKSEKRGYLYSPLSSTSLLLCFPVFLIKQRRADGAHEYSLLGVWARELTYVCMHVCWERVKSFRGGGLSSEAVSHHSIDPPGSFRCPSGFIILLSS